MHVGTPGSVGKRPSTAATVAAYSPQSTEKATTSNRPAEGGVLTTTRVPCARFGQYVLDTVRCDRHLSTTTIDLQTMRTPRYGCDLAGVLQTHSDLGPAWLPIDGNTTAFLRGYDSGGRVCRAWPSTTPYPLRSSLRRTGRRRLTLVGGVSWGLDPWARRLAGSPRLASPKGRPTGGIPGGWPGPDQTGQQLGDKGQGTRDKGQGLLLTNTTGF